MRGRGFLLGSILGVLAAAVLIAMVGVSGAAAHHIDLIPAVGQTTTLAGPSPSSQSVGTSTSVVQPGSQGPAQGSTAVGNLAAGGTSLIQTLSPLALAAALGAAFYGFYARRLNAE